jgi:pimeloyl-ACP methyl ester carboxylesterase
MTDSCFEIGQMDQLSPEFFSRPDGLRLAFRHRKAGGNAPTIIFLPGYKSDMLGGKAVALDAWAARQGHAMMRLDYAGCGESDGAFEDGTLASWRDDVLMLIDAMVRGPLVLVGSSMGGWLALLVAVARPSQSKGLIGIASAPDFTDWGFTLEEMRVIERDGRLERMSEYDPEPMITTLGFWQSGQANRLLASEIPIDCPVRLLHGQRDDTVPWEISARIAERLRSADVQMILVKDGDHRLARAADIALLITTLAHMLETL